MRMFVLTTTTVLLLALTTRSLAQDVQPINYTDAGIDLEGYLALPPGSNGTHPAVVILPDANGVNEYEQLRAVMVADDWGMVGFAADIYGRDLHNVTNTTQRSELLDVYRSNAALYTQRIQAAIDVVASLEQVDADQIALMGYCFGGTGVLTYALSGLNSVQAVVSFHGGLMTLSDMTATTGTNGTPHVLVLSGGDDDMSTDIVDLEATLNDANVTWEITRYANIQHAFTVFGDERYNQWADTRSWTSARGFLTQALGPTSFVTNQPDNVTGTVVPYTDVDGTPLQGYLSMPSSEWTLPHPVVVILPDWDGVTRYEQERATLLSSLGYAAFVADIYGVDMQETVAMDTDNSIKMEYATLFRSNMTLFVQRIERALAHVQEMDDMDADNMAVIGYCLGGTGIIQLAFSGNDNVKAVVSFHGGLEVLPPPMGNVTPYTLILSGGADDAHGNQTFLEESLDSVNADWEITRYARVEHGFTSWEYGAAYSLTADSRSWDSMLTTLQQLMAVPSQVGDDSGTSEDPGPNGPAPTPARPPTPSSSSDATLYRWRDGLLVAMVALGWVL